MQGKAEQDNGILTTENTLYRRIGCGTNEKCLYFFENAMRGEVIIVYQNRVFLYSRHVPARRERVDAQPQLVQLRLISCPKDILSIIDMIPTQAEYSKS